MTMPRKSISLAAALAAGVLFIPEIGWGSDFQREMNIINLISGKTLHYFIQFDDEAEYRRNFLVPSCGGEKQWVCPMANAVVQLLLADDAGVEWCIFRGVDLRPAHGMALTMAGEDGQSPVLVVLAGNGNMITSYTGVTSERSYASSGVRRHDAATLAFRESGAR